MSSLSYHRLFILATSSFAHGGTRSEAAQTFMKINALTMAKDSKFCQSCENSPNLSTLILWHFIDLNIAYTPTTLS